MQIIDIKEKEILDDFLKRQKHSQFLESWEWGEFQFKMENKIFRLGIEDEGKLIFTATLIKRKLFLNKSYFFIPRGPIFDDKLKPENYELLFDFFIREVKKIAKKENAVFLRFEPLKEFPKRNLKFSIKKSIDIQPAQSLILNIEKSEEELLKEMHQKTRYNINLALRKGITVREIKNIQKYFNDFWKIMEETRKRDNFFLHPREHYQEILNLDFIKLIGAFYKGKLIAVNIVSFFGDLVTYVHGASSNENRNLMAPYALQWETIKLAQKEGYKYYDFYGIDEKKWPGVTRFKKGFKGEEIEYPGTFDLIFNPNEYYFYKVFRFLRRII